MKRHVLIASVLLVTLAVPVLAQDTTILPEADPNVIEGPVAKPCPMCMMMAGHLFKSELIATADGGALLMIAGTLYKYDAELNLVAETQLQLDPQRMQTQLQEMMSSCPACQQNNMPMMRQWRGRRFDGTVPESGVTEGDGTTEGESTTEGQGTTETNGTTEKNGTPQTNGTNGQTNGAAESDSLQEYGTPDSSSKQAPKEKDKPEAKQPEETRL